jgi:hypothetical protein
MITIVFGKPGAGKTAYMVADAVRFMNYSADMCALHSSCCRQISSLNAEEQRFEMPVWAPVYSNFPIRVQSGVLAPVESYYIDGFHLGFENDDVEVMPVLPNSRIYLSEAQRYYNSRRSKDLPDWVSRFYEEHRHFSLEILLDVQRPGLIDVNIRELCGKFVEVQEMRNSYDRSGNLISSVFVTREFDDWKNVDQYLATGNAPFRTVDTVFHGCVFDYYQSMSYFNQFIPTRSDFALIRHLSGETDDASIELAKRMYQQTPPEGFYSKPERQSRGKRGVSDVPAAQ